MTAPGQRSNAVLGRFRAAHATAMDFTPGRMTAILAAVGNPQDHLPPVIHVAGTNGKGSTLAILGAILQAAGRRVHRFTSPWLFEPGECVVVAGTPLTDEALAELLAEIEAKTTAAPPTPFEALTTAALLAFSRTPADYVLLEAGMGGENDATNVVARPALTLLTPISLDHQAYLGDSLAEIAGNKAGILRADVPLLMAAQERMAVKVIETRAKDLGLPIQKEGQDWSVHQAGDGFVFTRGQTAVEFPLPGLAGAHQIRNAGLAIAAALALQDRAVGPQAVAMGLMSARWPARLQRLSEGRLAALLPDGWELWVDGAHNPGGVRTLVRTARNWRDKPLAMVLGMTEGRNPASFIKPLAGTVRLVASAPLPARGDVTGLSPQAVADALDPNFFEAKAADSIAEAIADLIQRGDQPTRILVTGSLYLAAAAIAQNAAPGKA